MRGRDACHLPPMHEYSIFIEENETPVEDGMYNLSSSPLRAESVDLSISSSR